MSVTKSPTSIELAEEIQKRRLMRLSSLGSAYQRKNSILSDISDCERQMVYSVLDWEKRPVAGPDLQARFEAGKEFEKQVTRELLEMGFEFQGSQMPVQIKNRAGETIATGKIDGFIVWNGSKIPVEIKSMNMNVFDSVKSVEDFQKKPWLRRYTRQLIMYLFGHNQEWGLFIVGDLLGHWKMLPLALDYGEAESILQRLERVHDAIKANKYPDRILYDSSVCGKCPFSSICLQDINNKEAMLWDNEALEMELEKHERLKPIAAEYESLHEKIRDVFSDTEKAIIGGSWLVQNVPSQRTVYDIPDEAAQEIDEIKKQYAVKKPVRRLVIERIGAANG